MNRFSDADIQGIINDAIARLGVADRHHGDNHANLRRRHAPGIASNRPDTLGYNNFYFHGARHVETEISGSVSSQNTTVSDSSYIFSHEVAEAMVNGTTVTPAPSSSPAAATIRSATPRPRTSATYPSSGLACNRTGRSTSGPTSSRPVATQSFTLLGSTLFVYGDQLGFDYSDNVTISTDLAGGIQVNLNGEVANFDPVDVSVTAVQVMTGEGSTR